MLGHKNTERHFSSGGNIEEIGFGHRQTSEEDSGSGQSTIIDTRQLFFATQLTSEMTWSGHQPIEGLGPIGSGASGLQGFHLHSVLAVRWQCEVAEAKSWPTRPAVDVLGLPVQHYHVRKPRPKGEPANNSKLMKQRARESQWWLEAGQALGPAPADKQIEWCASGKPIRRL
jgi:hypothetical protein